MISIVVLTKNEEKKIKDCLSSLFWCDEMVVIDDYSDDKSAVLAQEMGAKVFKRALDGDFAAQRNFGLEKAKGDWVLFIDADERVTEALASEIKSRIGEVGPALAVTWVNRSKRRPFPSGSDLDCKGFYIKRRDFIFGKWLNFGEAGKMKLLRLARKDAGQWQGVVHEAWQVKGEVGELKFPLLHHPHSCASEFLKRINQYSTLRARELYSERKKTNFFEIIAYPTGKFLRNFFWNLGFLDGLPGFLHAIFMSFHSFLVRGKLWLFYFQV